MRRTRTLAVPGRTLLLVRTVPWSYLACIRRHPYEYWYSPCGLGQVLAVLLAKLYDSGILLATT